MKCGDCKYLTQGENNSLCCHPNRKMDGRGKYSHPKVLECDCGGFEKEEFKEWCEWLLLPINADSYTLFRDAIAKEVGWDKKVIVKFVDGDTDEFIFYKPKE